MPLGVVIVTYKDRVSLTLRVTRRILEYSPCITCIVVNGYSKSSIQELRFQLSGLNVKIVEFENNLGSASGYKEGISYIYKLCSTILLLDDDNLLSGTKKDMDNLLKLINLDKNIAYSIYREDRPEIKKAYLENKPELIIGKPNSFLSFDLTSKLLHHLGLQMKKIESNNNKLPCAPYGGLLFHSDNILRVGLPFKEFFSYGDDYEWTYRFSISGIHIHHTEKLKIIDLEKSWHVSNDNIFQKLQKCDLERFELIVQNRKKFENIHRISNKLIYRLNKTIFIFLFFIFGGDIARIKILKK